jgi:hypothetical protein
MKMQKKFDESNITFQFDEQNWDICQYDESNGDYRKNVHLPETKAVDFVGIYNKNTIVLFEIKSFRGYSNQQNVQNRLSDNMEKLSTEVAQKVRDTIAIIAGLNRTVRQNPFWERLEKLICDTNKQIIVIAWVEEDTANLNETEKKRDKVNKGVKRKEKFQKKLNWLTSFVYLINIKEQCFKFDGFNANLMN